MTPPRRHLASLPGVALVILAAPVFWCAAHPAAARDAPDYDAHVAALKTSLPDGFTVVVHRPFVVIGDEEPAMVRRRADRTIGWAVRMLKQDFFESDPDHIIDVYLFKDKASYETHAQAFFGRKPNTPYGYYSRADRAMVMNIATGGGTLVHEIVHPYMETNFPNCPAWFNEGLGSLYEQSAEAEGKIVGLPNWRLPGLKRAIWDDATLTLRQLTALSTAEFYGEGSGLHYAQARYLCYYLQQKKLLRPYYHAFVANQAEDPTGYQTLREVLGEDGRDMARFQRSWERYVARIPYGR